MVCERIYIRGGGRVLDVGSYGVNGVYRDLFKENNIEYVGLDIEAGPNVDIVVKDSYCWDCLPDESFDYIISGQAFEHIEYPWLTIKEIYKKLFQIYSIFIIIISNYLSK